MAVEVDFIESPVFTANAQSDKPINVNQGGSSSGKTYSILQLLMVLLWSEPNLIATVVGQDIPNLKAGAMRTLGFVLKDHPYFRGMVKAVNKTERTWTLHNDSILEFKSFEDALDAQGGRRDYLFVNEAPGITYAIFDQLNIRTEKKVFIDYNPAVPFWAHTELIGKAHVKLIISDYTHNPVLSQSIIAKIEAYRDDPKYADKWRVYGQGLTGATEGVIFKHVDWISEFPAHITRISYGMDFGFTNDPTTLNKIGTADGELYVECLLYKTGLITTNVNPKKFHPNIDNELTKLGINKKKDRIYADNAAPKTIRELQLKGWNIRGGKKGADSIVAGINSILKYAKLNIVECKEWKEEQIGYIWDKDKKTGKSLNKPVDKNNHNWDGTRYGIQGLRSWRAKTRTS
jgi:phage terminase large subunit